MGKKVSLLVQSPLDAHLHSPELDALESERESLRCVIREMTEVMEAYLEGLAIEARENQLSR